MNAKFVILFLSAFVYLIGSSANAEQGKMVFAVDLIRHGDRSPIKEIPNAPFAWPQGLGQLTPEGMAQEFKLGTEFRERYVNHYHLLPPEYLAETMQVQSSDVNRTLMSAECALMGLYPPGTGPKLDEGSPPLPHQYQPIPIHTKPRDQDTMLVADSNSKFTALVNEYSHSAPAWKEYTARVQPQFSRWSQLSGMPISALEQVVNLEDALHIHQLHHVPIPKGMTDDDISAIQAAGEWAFAHTFTPPQVGDCAGHELLAAIAKYFDQASQHKSKLKFVLFSAHDSTIASVMSAMRAPLERRAHYASDLNIALFDDGQNFTVQATLNGDPISIPGATDGTCSLAQFQALCHNQNLPVTTPIQR